MTFPKGRPITAIEAFDRIECLVAEHGDENSQLANAAFGLLKVVMGIATSIPPNLSEEEERALKYYQCNPSRAVEDLSASRDRWTPPLENADRSIFKKTYI